MAKSIRSKRKRKMRNVKRDRNGPRELDKLKKTLQNLQENVLNDDTCKITTRQQLVDKKVILTDSEKMETSAKTRSKKTLKNKDGNYPIWMSGKEVKKIRAAKTGKRIGRKKKLAW